MTDRDKTITLKLDLPIKLLGDSIEVYNLATMKVVLGTSSVSGNYHMYNVTKPKPGVWRIPYVTFGNRIDAMEKRKKNIDETLVMMKKIAEFIYEKRYMEKQNEKSNR